MALSSVIHLSWAFPSSTLRSAVFVYLDAKYGYGTDLGYLAPAEELFERRDIEKPIAAAEGCQLASSRLKYLEDRDLDSLIGEWFFCDQRAAW